MTVSVGIVTGGGGGIGAATVSRLARRGLHVVILDIDGKAAHRVASSTREQGLSAVAAQCDVTDPESIAAALNESLTEDDRVQTLVNCAGLAGPSRRMAEVPPSEWDSILRVNLTGTAQVMLAALPHMSDGSSIVNVSSIAGLNGSRGQVPYSMAKSGIHGLTKAVAKELLKRRIRVNAVAPGFIQTPMTDAMPEYIRSRWRVEQLAIGGMGTPEQVAACIDFLTSDASSYVTGIVLNVDGGFSLGYP